MARPKKRKQAHGEDGVIKFTNLMKTNKLNSVLDIGGGEEETHANYMRKQGLTTYVNDFFDNSAYQGDFNSISFDRIFNGIHAAHVLEHQLNPNLFLKKIHSLLAEDGYLCITVPPLKHQIVGGHVSLWNAGLVLYHLVHAGFDCSNAMIKVYTYNITVIVKKKTVNTSVIPFEYDSVDINLIAPYLPKFRFGKLKCKTFDGNIQSLNW